MDSDFVASIFQRLIDVAEDIDQLSVRDVTELNLLDVVLALSDFRDELA